MSHVMLALVPGTAAYTWLIDPRILLNVALAVLVGLCVEALLLRLRHRPVQRTLHDGSIILAAWLLALCVPPSLPHWHLVIGVCILAGLGKHLFGGLGHNPFNPAMVAYAVLLVSFPVTMTAWPADSQQSAKREVSTSLDAVSASTSTSTSASTAHSASAVTAISASASVPGSGSAANWDAVTGATPLDRLRQLRLAPPHAADIAYRDQAADIVLQSPWRWVNLCWLAGGLYLLLLRVISWHIPVAMLSTLAGLYAVQGLIDRSTAMPILAALQSGAILLGAFFIATDPVSAAASRIGKLIYAAGIGVFCFIIREFSSYPEGLAFAVLLMNIAVPLIDYLSGSSGGKASGGSL